MTQQKLDRPAADGAGHDATAVEAVAAEAFAVIGSGRQVAPFSQRHPAFGLAQAYRVTPALRAKREARGERPAGRKIGFTNRAMWEEFKVDAPIWGHVYDGTVRDLPAGGADFSLQGLTEPRIEPEIVFGLAAAPAPGMDDAAVLGCIGWVAHGFEIVQSIFPGWKFAAADTVAAGGLHGALLIGPRHPVGADAGDWQRRLTAFEIEIFRDGVLADQGRGANVLDGPVSSLRHLVELLGRDRFNPPLAAGEVVTTGTLTRAFPVAAGETWTTKLSGIALEGARIHFI